MEDNYWHSPSKRFKTDSNMNSGYWGQQSANSFSGYSSFSNSAGNQSSYQSNNRSWGRGRGGGVSSGYGRNNNYGNQSGGYGGNSYGGMSSYENEPSSTQVDQMFKKFRKMEMMQEIAKLEEEAEEYMYRQRFKIGRGRMNFGSGRGGGYGFGSFERPGFGPMGGYNSGFSSYDAGMGYNRNNGWGAPSGYDSGWGGRGRLENRSGRGYQGRGGGPGGRGGSRGVGGRGRNVDRRLGYNKRSAVGNRRGDRKRNLGKRENNDSGDGGGRRNKKQRKGRKPKIDENKPMDEESRNKRLLFLMEKIKTFEDRPNAIFTLEDCISKYKCNVDIFFYRKTASIFLDKLFFARAMEKPNKNCAYKQAIEKLRTKTLDEIKEEAANMPGNISIFPDAGMDVPKELNEEMRTVVTKTEMTEKPFKERLAMFIEAINDKTHHMVLIRLYGTKYMINLVTVYDYHPDETTDIHEARIYANEVLLSQAKGPIRKTIEDDVVHKMLELFKTKTIEEIMENDGRYSQDYPNYPTFARHRGVGYQVETNAFQLRFSMFVNDLDSIKDRDPGDIVLFEDSTWDGSWVKILEESATYSRLVVKTVWSLEHPGEPEEGEEVPPESDEDDKNEEEQKDGREADRKRMGLIRECEKHLFTDVDGDITVKRAGMAKVARKQKCMLVKCQIFLQDKLIGEGYGTYKNNASRMACMRAVRNLMSTQSSVYHLSHRQTFNEQSWEEIQKKARELKQSLPEPPNFDHVKSMDVLPDEGKEIDDLAPWAKEVVRRDLERLSQSDILTEEDIVYSNTPMYIRDVVGHYLNPYGLHMKSRFNNSMLTKLTINKVLQDTEAVVKSLLECKDYKSKGYILEQVRREDGTVEVLNKDIGKHSDNKLNTLIARFKDK